MSVSRIVEDHRPEASSTELAKPVDFEIVAPQNIGRLEEVFKTFQEFKQRLLTKDDSITIAGRQYLKKSAWRKWALACGISDEIVSIERIPSEGRTKDGEFQYRIVARALHKPTGRSSIGVAAASNTEKSGWSHEEHDVFTLCHTRSKNRAIADLVGGGEVSAEEIVPDTANQRPPGKPEQPETGTAAKTESPVPPAPRPEEWTPKVPALAALLTPEQQPQYAGVKQYDLWKNGVTFGVINQLDEELSVVPVRPMPVNKSTIDSFLVPKILQAMKLKHGLEFWIQADTEGMLTAIFLRGKTTQSQILEIRNGARWAFEKQLEKATGKK